MGIGSDGNNLHGDYGLEDKQSKMMFTKIGVCTAAGYVVFMKAAEVILSQVSVPEVSVSLLNELIQKGGTVAALAVVLWFSWKHHLTTVKYYRDRLEAKDRLFANMVKDKDDEIRRLNEKINGK